MGKAIFFLAGLIIIVLVATISGLISITRLGQILIGIGLIMVLTGALALAGLPVLRGDVSEQRPIEAEELKAIKGTVPIQGKRLVMMGLAILIIGVMLVIFINMGLMTAF